MLVCLMKNKSEISPSCEARFLSKVDKRTAEECWPWKAGKNDTGAGMFWINGKQVHAYIIAKLLEVGEIADGVFICHRCDNRACCNPAHLFIGDALLNNRDASIKGRSAKGSSHGRSTMPSATAKGSRHGMAKLSEATVLDIRSDFSMGMPRKAIALKHNTTISSVKLIVRRATWKHLP